MPTVPNSVYALLDAELQEHMFRSGGYSDAKTPVLSSQANLVVEQRLKLGHVVRKRDELTTQPLGLKCI
ncbi:hypothetical protein TNCV_334761 [Trichonephila clavipes]|nr:hypothetical protein TNCV_334761 [Trichonephila clavipes]